MMRNRKIFVLSAAAALVMFGVGCGTQAASTDSLSDLPQSVPGMENRAEQLARFDRPDDTVDTRAEAAEKLSAAYGGAAVRSQAYADEGLMRFVTVFAVAAASPGLWSSRDTEVLAERLRLPLPPEHVIREAEGECLIQPAANVPDSTGPTVQAGTVLECQAVRDDVSVIATDFGGDISPDLGMQIVRAALDHVTRGAA